MESILLRGLVWETRSGRFQLDRDELSARPGQVCVVVTKQAAIADAFVDVLVGLAVPLDGSIRVSGESVASQPAGSRKMALVPLGGGLFPHMTVEANIAYPLGPGRSRSYRGKLARYAARRVGMEPFLRRYPPALSADEQVKASLARALCGEPAVVVFEDRRGHAPCHTAVAAAVRADVAVIVVTDDPSRVEGASEQPAWEVVESDET
ncbi:ATP-binding cassette domain-containing protein [Nonomuraea sp. NPDC000554]|uniref:ATP-binding cassette domain-containing protein n=1 Tax=Nonomuraea sp. NPDC000554 TaxID=3154259 RepID=UPI00331E4430